MPLLTVTSSYPDWLGQLWKKRDSPMISPVFGVCVTDLERFVRFPSEQLRPGVPLTEIFSVLETICRKNLSFSWKTFDLSRHHFCCIHTERSRAEDAINPNWWGVPCLSLSPVTNCQNWASSSHSDTLTNIFWFVLGDHNTGGVVSGAWE